MQDAVSHHVAGRLGEAEAIYRQTLAADPKNFDALHLLGVICQQRGNGVEAVALIEQAVDVRPTDAAAHSNLGVAYRGINRMDAAESSLRTALALNPYWDTAHVNLGTVAQARGNRQEAEVCFRKALELNPANADACNNLANIRKELGDIDQAEQYYRAALALNPESADVWNNLGAVLRQRGMLHEAEMAFHEALSRRESHADAHNNLGIVLRAQGRLDEAEASFLAAVDAQPDFVEARSNLGALLQALGRLDEAERQCRKALELRPDNPDALSNLGAVYKKRGDRAMAEEHCRKALALNPDHAGSHSNLGTILNELDRPEDAERCFRRAAALDPSDAVAKFNLATSLLLRGEYEEGFALYESRMNAFPREYVGIRGILTRYGEKQSWNGESLAGKRLLVWTEQGFGDSLMMMRYLPMLKVRGASVVIVACDAPLQEIMRAMRGVDDVVPMTEHALPPFDVHCSMLSLPCQFATTYQTVPALSPYLRAPDLATQRWRLRLGHTHQAKVGVAWAGSSALVEDKRRSLSISELAPLFDIDSVSWISLQKERATDRGGKSGARLSDWMDECADFMDTAALIDSLDLVISVDTAVAHLAAALGKPVWLLNRHRGDWRWGAEGNRAIWYPTMRQFRQDKTRSWRDVVIRVKQSLAAELTKR